MCHHEIASPMLLLLPNLQMHAYFFDEMVALLNASKLGVPEGKSVSMPGEASAMRAFFNLAGVRVSFLGMGANDSSNVTSGLGKTA